MSKIFDLAKDFEAKSKQQASATESSLKHEFERHERSVREALISSVDKIKSDISAQNAIMSRLVLRSWIWVGATLIIVFGAIQGVLWWQGNEILTNQREIESQRANLRDLESRGAKIQLNYCGEKRQLCARVQKKLGEFGTDGQTYMILAGD
ncbi:MbeB family mobilization protein [Shewanella xiamenensis]|jgi:hypothetical protein|uniref:MbeB family mobilization protein n=1 Tax=Shewanella xiamenensis TaxID=332186 RepID=UPI00217A5EBE|nr:hypothetical protein NUITMVS3_44380 [Shewanella xiamenensis]